MTHPTDWDVDQHRTTSESEEQWKLRRDFMTKWKTEIPEDRLVCLARVFINIEFLGCRYPSPVMRQVAELSKEVAAKFREQKKFKLQRTFVSASDAAEDRARGTKRSHDGRQENFKSKKTVFVAAQHRESPNQRKFNDEPLARNEISISNRYGNLVLYIRSPNETCAGKLTSSCQTCKTKIEWIFDQKNNEWFCECIINGIKVSNGTGESQKLAKENCAESSWNTLQKECYTIKMVQSHVSKEDAKISASEVRSDKKAPIVDKLDVKVESAVASRMMKLMGWKGGSLGTKGDGISEPIAPNLKQIHRAGLGSSSDNTKIIRSAIKRIISEFRDNGNSDYDLVFANDFTKEERIEMHKVALHHGLKSKSYGRDEDRYLVISKHVTPAQLVQSLLNNGGSNDKYILTLPTG